MILFIILRRSILPSLITWYSVNVFSRYILHQVSGPFLSEATAHYNITLSCISYLHTSLSLIDPNIPPEQVRTHVLLGYHGLHRYADEFWTDHLLQYLRLGGVFDVSILEALDDLLQFQKFDLTQGSDNELDRDSVISSLATQLELLSQMSNFPEIQVFVRRLLLFRAQSVMDRKDADKDQKGTHPADFSANIIINLISAQRQGNNKLSMTHPGSAKSPKHMKPLWLHYLVNQLLFRPKTQSFSTSLRRYTAQRHLCVATIDVHTLPTGSPQQQLEMSMSLCIPFATSALNQNACTRPLAF